MSYTPPATPTRHRIYTYVPDEDPHFQVYLDEIKPRVLFPGRLERRNARVTRRDIARHTCEREDCMLCLPYR